MFLIRDVQRKIKKNEKITAKKGFLIFEFNEANKKFCVSCIPYNSDSPITKKTFNDLIKTIDDNGIKIIENYIESENGVSLSELINSVKEELSLIIKNGITKIK